MLKQGGELYFLLNDEWRPLLITRITKDRVYFSGGVNKPRFYASRMALEYYGETYSHCARKSPHFEAGEQWRIVFTAERRDDVCKSETPYHRFDHFFRLVVDIKTPDGIAVHSFRVKSLKERGVRPSQIAKELCRGTAKAEYKTDIRGSPFLHIESEEKGSAAATWLLHLLRGKPQDRVHHACEEGGHA
jgi:hypothetical protein